MFTSSRGLCIKYDYCYSALNTAFKERMASLLMANTVEAFS